MPPNDTSLSSSTTAFESVRETDSPAELARAAIRRLAANRLPPTPENFAAAYRTLAGDFEPVAAAQAPLDDDAGAGAQWGVLISALVRGLERNHRGLSVSRKRDAVLHVVAATSRSKLLRERLMRLVQSWEHADEVSSEDFAATAAEPAFEQSRPTDTAALSAALAPSPADASLAEIGAMPAMLMSTLQSTLPDQEPTVADLAASLQRFAHELESGALNAADTGQILRARKLATQVERIAHRRERLLTDMRELLGEACGAMSTMSSDCGWMHKQVNELRMELEGSLDTRLLAAARETLREAALRQAAMADDRKRVHDSIKQLLAEFIDRLSDVGLRTGAHHDRIVEYARRIESANSLDDLSETLDSLLDETRGMRDVMKNTQSQMQSAQSHVVALETRVRALESELADASEQLQTDPLTGALNRRGVEAAFAEAARRVRATGQPFAVALFDIDNFKRLNDTFGHAAGDETLVQLTRLVRANARPSDALARYGGEEFVLLMPGAKLEEAATVVRRAQRAVTHECFLHDDRRLFVTFSAGVTLMHPGESLSQVLSRADEALYQAKSTGKNRVCTV
ncbi:MAG TPA: GGDEF domain-containing protein [Burkholderiaceae bacterium]|nr:GGDEF domain-containing protein [Burkholderiaceae bacterium]